MATQDERKRGGTEEGTEREGRATKDGRNGGRASARAHLRDAPNHFIAASMSLIGTNAKPTELSAIPYGMKIVSPCFNAPQL